MEATRDEPAGPEADLGGGEDGPIDELDIWQRYHSEVKHIRADRSLTPTQRKARKAAAKVQRDIDLAARRQLKKDKRPSRRPKKQKPPTATSG